jgi:hypothetical protein
LILWTTPLSLAGQAKNGNFDRILPVEKGRKIGSVFLRWKTCGIGVERCGKLSAF